MQAHSQVVSVAASERSTTHQRHAARNEVGGSLRGEGNRTTLCHLCAPILTHQNPANIHKINIEYIGMKSMLMKLYLILRITTTSRSRCCHHCRHFFQVIRASERPRGGTKVAPHGCEPRGASTVCRAFSPGRAAVFLE